ncbi:MAG TPA: VOC family protein [Actinotalea sp.]|nr:VOC family protein [Actinotalea sp.]
MGDKSPRRRGRPPTTSAAQIARTALELFLRDGYDGTTLDDVAAAVGVGRSTVLRYFDSKGAIVWEGEAAAAGSLLVGLAGRATGPGWRGDVAEALVGAIRFPRDDEHVLRLRLRLIEGVPALRRHLHGTADAAIAALADHIARSTHGRADDLVPDVVARTAWWTAMDALLWWARAGDGDPHDAVRAALAAVGLSRAEVRLSATVLDARDPGVLARFYAGLLGWDTVVDEPTWVMLRPPGGGAGLSFQLEPLHVAPTWPARAGSEQIQAHLDLAVRDLEREVARAVGLGAVLALVQPQTDVRVLLDPEGHAFCLFVA